MKRKKTNDDFAAQYAAITRSQNKLLHEYSGITLTIPEVEKWDYAIPEMYTNFQDGFLFPKHEAYKGMPIIQHPLHGVLYLRWEVPYYALQKCEKEKFLCFDRHGNKYTVVITECPEQKDGNPSYFRLLPKVKKYIAKHHSRL